MALFVSSGNAHAQGLVSTDLSVTVPQVCSVSVATGPYLEGTQIRIDAIRELCNTSGYNLILEYTPGALIGAVVEISGQTTVLDGSGSATLFTSSIPVSRTSDLAIRLVDTPNEALSLSLRAVIG